MGPASLRGLFVRRFTDVFSTEDWALEMVPSPVLAVLFLYPIKESVRADGPPQQRCGVTV